jgi:carboxylesterase
MSLRLAAQRPGDVHAIALFSPTLWPDGWNIPWTFNLMKLFLHKWSANLVFLRERAPYGLKDERMRRFVMEAVSQQPGGAAELAGFYGGTILEFRWMVEAVRSTLGSIRQPTLIVHPRQDDRSSLSNANELAQKLGGITEIVVLNDSYHVCTLDRQRDVVIDRMVEFVARVSSEARAAEIGQSRRLR